MSGGCFCWKSIRSAIKIVVQASFSIFFMKNRTSSMRYHITVFDLGCLLSIHQHRSCLQFNAFFIIFAGIQTLLVLKTMNSL